MTDSRILGRRLPNALDAGRQDAAPDVTDHANGHGIEPPTLTRVSLKNYRSIADCMVDLKPLTLLVGPNGAGKSNFIDGVKFASDSLRTTVEHALRERGGIKEVRRRSRGHPTHFGIRLELRLARDTIATYSFQIVARRGGAFEVRREECRIRQAGKPVAHFTVDRGRLTSSSDDRLPESISPDRLFLQIASARPFFQDVYGLLSSFGFYNLNLRVIRELQDPNVGELLQSDGGNLAAVISMMRDRDPDALRRLEEYLGAVVPGVHSVSAKSLGPKETIEIRQEVAGDSNPWRYLAANVSDGTLRALGVLAAVLQSGTTPMGIPLVTIEEPEIAIHPGASVRLMDALLEASRSRQLIITTHSPDLLDHPRIDVDSILAVEAASGNSLIAPVDNATRNAVRGNLYTVGELLRLEQVRPQTASAEEPEKLELFGTGGPG